MHLWEGHRPIVEEGAEEAGYAGPTGTPEDPSLLLLTLPLRMIRIQHPLGV